MSDILVTGASGFIGARLVDRLEIAGHQVYAVNSSAGDIAESDSWRKFPEAKIVVHLAARSFVPESWDNPAEYMRVNLQGTMGALEYCRKRKARLVFLSSYVYGKTTKLPILESTELAARNPYALSKILSEDACRFYAKQWGLKVTILRPFNVYGANQGDSFLIPSIINQIRAGAGIRVNDLAPKRDYVYIEDVVLAIEAAINSKTGEGTYNVASGLSYSVDEIISCIQEILGTTLPVSSANERRHGEIMDTVGDITAARDQLGWIPQFSLRDGLYDMLGST